MAGEVIKEFLVALGFKTDEPTLKRFKESIESATLRANLLANAITEMAKTIVENVSKSANQLESLYYTAIRTGSSATQLKALGQAAQDFGISADEAIGYVDHLRELLYKDPGKEGFLNHLGIRTRESNGELRNTVDIFNDLGQVLARTPGDAMANQLASVVDLNYRLQKMVRDPGWLGDLAEHQRLLTAGDYENAARKAAMLEQQWRKLQDRWDALKTRFELPLFQHVISGFESVGKWLDAHAPGIEAWVNGIAEALERLYRIGSLVFGKLWGKLNSTLGDNAPQNNAVQNFTKKYIDDPLNFAADKVWHGLLGKLGISSKDVQAALTLPPRQDVSDGLDANNPLNLEYAGQPGATRFGGGPYAGRFAAFPTASSGLEAGGRQLELYFARGLDNIQKIITRWAPPGENDTAAYIADVSKRMHRASGERLNLQDPTVLSSLMNAMVWHEQNRNPYAPGLVRSAAETAISQGGDMTVNQTNHFEIDGSRDPQATRQAVHDALRDAFSRATRNMAPTTQ